MSNVLVTCSIVAKETLVVLENQLAFASNVNRKYEDEFTGNQSRGYSPGQTINIKRPPRYTYRVGRVAAPQATVETTVPLTLSQGGVDMYFTSFEKTLQLQQFKQKVMAAMAPITNEIDRQGLALARLSTFNTIGTPGTLPTTTALALAAATGVGQRLDEMGAPFRQAGGRTFVANPGLNASMLQGYAGLFNNQEKLGQQFGSGVLVPSLGMKYAMGQNVDVHTNGSQPVAGTNINGANQTGSTITVVGLGGNITRGTKITLPGVFAVNPQSRTTTGTLAQFVVTADAAAAATTLSISPAIVTSGAFQNVTASPTNGAPFVIFGTASGSYNANLFFHSDAFTLACVPMDMPGKNGVIDVAQETYEGMTIKVTQYYDGVNDATNMRLDVLYGWAATYPELACIYAT